ncbi:hypothetical protein [Streptomyces sp. NPDC000851]
MAEVVVLPGHPGRGGAGGDRVAVARTSMVRMLREKYPASA